MMSLLAHASNIPQGLSTAGCTETEAYGMMGWPMMNSSYGIGFIPALVVWILIILVLIALFRYLWVKGSESSKSKK